MNVAPYVAIAVMCSVMLTCAILFLPTQQIRSIVHTAGLTSRPSDYSIYQLLAATIILAFIVGLL